MEHLSRLSSKPGVQSTLVLSKTDGAIIYSTGLLSKTSPPTLINNEFETTTIGVNIARSTHADEKARYGSQQDEGKRSAEEVARMVYSFVSAANDLAKDLEEGDVVQLLRLRTRRAEIVVVPGK